MWFCIITTCALLRKDKSHWVTNVEQNDMSLISRNQLNIPSYKKVSHVVQKAQQPYDAE